MYKESRREVISYIYNALRFYHEKGRDFIYAPYNFEYVKKNSLVVPCMYKH